MANLIKNWLLGKKSVPFIDVLTETTREGLNKAYIPKFLYKPPFGYPRYANLDYVRYLAQTPYVEMCIDTILKEMAAIDWSIVPNDDIPERIQDQIFYDKDGALKPQIEAEINHIKSFFLNPNTNPDEDFEYIFIKQAMRDVLEVNTGVVNKIFNLKQEMVELVARDGATFTKNPDIHGMYTNREDILLPKKIVNNASEVVNPFQHIATPLVTEKAAYFQYGWISGPVPQPFGKREIVWMQNMVRSDDIYGYSPVQLLAKSLQMLLYHIEADLEYYNDNNVPKGIIGIDASDSDEIKSFKDQWYEQQRKKDEFGNWKKIQHKVPILNYLPKFERIEFSSQELQLIEKQKWYTKMVWACFGVTSTELGYTEDAQGQANQIVQSKVFRKKSINPNLRMIEKRVNRNVIPEFEYNVLVPIGKKMLPMNKYRFKFNLFDIDEEKSKAELFEKWIDNGLKTVNEIRLDEGLKPVEWGDEKPQKFRDQAQSFNFGNDGGKDFNARQSEALDTDKNISKQQGSRSPEQNVQKTEKQLQNQKSIESKPFAGYDSFAACVRANSDKRDPEAYCAEIERQTEGKAQGMDNPLILKENEVPDMEQFRKGLLYVLKENEEMLIKILKKEMGQDQLKQIKADLEAIDLNAVECKGLNDLIRKLKDTLSFQGLKGLAHAVIRGQFIKGAESSEEKINEIKPFNYIPDKDAIEFISNYTFDNIKDMTDELANDLRQELERGFMNGEGINDLTKRVKSIFDSSEHRAETIARTETMRAHQFGKLNAYQQSGVKAKKWLLWTDDRRTSEITRALHKLYGSPEQAIPLNENFKATVKVGKKVKVINQPAGPFHPNERDELMILPDEDQD